jgi:hypothetical protein
VSITAVIENDTIKLPAGVHLPDGTPVRVESLTDGTRGAGWPPGYFERTAGALVGERFERPEQGSLPQREKW